MFVLSLSWSNDAFNVKTNQQCSFGDVFSNHYSTTDIRPKPVLAKRSDSLYNLVYTSTTQLWPKRAANLLCVCVFSHVTSSPRIRRGQPLVHSTSAACIDAFFSTFPISVPSLSWENVVCLV
jgi:hypothetical protein